MLSVVVILIGLIGYALAYRFYSKWYDKAIIETDPKKTTPAHMYMDGVEFFPTSRYVLLGYQWKGIAALGPVVGPITAIVWGWLPAFLWLLFGNMFIGWIHDYSSMMVSVRHEGSSFGPIAHELISPRARTILLWFLQFYLIILCAAMGYTVSTIFWGYPTTAVPVLVVTIIGIASGFLLYKLKMNVVYVTVLAIVVMFLGVWLGSFIPFSVDVAIRETFWLFFVFLFCFIGAVTPIWSFAQPIIYISFYLVYFGIATMILGVFAGRPDFYQPAFTSFFAPPIGGMAYPAPLWPLLFVVIACGAISGWHSLVGSSGSSKQLDTEADGCLIGAGSMYLEGIMAFIALITVAILTPDLFKATPAGAPRFVAGGSQLLTFIGIPVDFAKAWAAVILVILAITVVQLNLRFARITMGEIAGARFGGIFKNPYVSSIVCLIVATVLCHSYFGGLWFYIWAIFGSVNQLMAGLALTIITLWLLTMGKRWIVTGIPMAFMVVTTIVALFLMAHSSYIRATTLTGVAIVGNIVALVFVSACIILALLLIWESAKAFGRIRAKKAAEVKPAA